MRRCGSGERGAISLLFIAAATLGEDDEDEGEPIPGVNSWVFSAGDG